MTQIKSYTSLEQAKELLKILPHQSADMSFNVEKGYEVILHPYMTSPWIGVPCWSLAALLEQFPYELCDDDGNSLYLEINKEDDVYQLVYADRYGDFESIETDRYEHFVDACYELILKLNELNLL